MTLATKNELEKVLEHAFSIFREKMDQYGPAWIGFSFFGFADQIFIKAHRYKTLVHTEEQRVPEPPEVELYAIINYCVLFLIARDRGVIKLIFDSPTAMVEEITPDAREKLLGHYENEVRAALALQEDKDHDYGSAWQSLSREGIADIIFAKVVRMKAMLSAGRTPCDDDNGNGIAATLRDLINYSAFALILDSK